MLSPFLSLPLSASNMLSTQHASVAVKLEEKNPKLACSDLSPCKPPLSNHLFCFRFPFALFMVIPLLKVKRFMIFKGMQELTIVTLRLRFTLLLGAVIGW